MRIKHLQWGRGTFASVGLAAALTAVPALGSNQSPEVQPINPETSQTRAVSEPASALDVAMPLDAIRSAAHAAGITPRVLDMALGAVTCAVRTGDIAVPPTLTVIDYSRASTEPRLWVFDLERGTLLFHELVAHGRNTGENMATRFSDTLDSRQSSLGLFVTRDTYVGSNGYSLRLDGLEPGFNGRARERAIVMHGAPYVDAALAASQGRIGRSWGCPALRAAVARDVIDTIRGGGVIFSYYPDQDWLRGSRFLNGCASSPAEQILATS